MKQAEVLSIDSGAKHARSGISTQAVFPLICLTIALADSDCTETAIAVCKLNSSHTSVSAAVLANNVFNMGGDHANGRVANGTADAPE